MGYRMSHHHHEHIDDAASRTVVTIDNGTINRIEIPCEYAVLDDGCHHDCARQDHEGWPSPDSPDDSCQIPSCPRHGRHITLEPIDLEAEGYESIEVMFLEPPYGLEASGSIDESTITVTITAMCPSANERDAFVPVSVYAIGTYAEDDQTETPLRDVVLKGLLRIVAGPVDGDEPTPTPGEQIGTDGIEDGAITLDKLDQDVIDRIDSRGTGITGDDIEDGEIGWDKLTTDVHDRIEATNDRITKTSGGNTISLVANASSSGTTLRLDGIGVYITRGTFWQSQSSVPGGSWVDYGPIPFGHTYTSPPTVVVGLYSTSVDSELGLINVALKSTTTTDFTVRVFNNDNTTRQPGFTWIAIG